MEYSKKTNIKFNIMAIVLIIVFAIAITPKTLQNDTFYTIKIGEYVLQKGVTMQDPFSWHNLSYTYPHWAYDVMMYFIYNVGGHLGIYISTIIFASILGIIMYFMNDKFSKNKPISFVLVISSMFLLKDFIAARAQLFTFILFVLEVLFIENFLETGKKRYIIGLIIIPIMLANFHVAVFPFYFVLYLPYIAEYLISIIFDIETQTKRKIEKLNKKIKESTNEEKTVKFIKKQEKIQQILIKIQERKKGEPYKVKIERKKNTKILIIIMIVCMFAGLLTPLKDVPYTYLLNTMKGNSTKNISEHLPLTLAHNINYAVVLVFFLSILIFTDTKIRLCDMFMLGGLTFLTFMSQRQESLFILLCIPIFNRMITAFLNKYDKNGIYEMTKYMTTICGAIITICICLILSIVLYGNRFKDNYVDEKSYPIKASEWILENLNINEVKIYNEYNYGSYLLFKGIPVFVDSRADLYLPEFNEGVTVFNDFLTISSLGTMNMDGIINKYGFTHFITKSNAKLRIYLDAKPEEYKIIYKDDDFYIYEINK